MKSLVRQRKPRHERITRINSKVARDINRAIILNSVRQHQPISRTKISDITRLNKSTVSDIVATLIEEQLLAESPDLRKAIGRNPRNLTVRQGRHFVGAISLNSPTTSIAIVDIDGTVRARSELSTQSDTPRDLIGRSMKKLMMMRASVGTHQFRGIGVTVAGIVDASQARVVYSMNLNWEGVDLEALVREQLADVEIVSAENDAKASALAELLLGTHDLPSNDLVFVSFGVGIGVGATIHGRILNGYSHAAGELGHMTLVEGGRPCVCGSRGCWEAYASDAAIIDSYLSRKGKAPGRPAPTTIEDVLRASNNGEAEARETLSEAAHYAGIGIANLVKAFDPEAVIVAGTPKLAWDIFRPVITQSVEKNTRLRHHTPAQVLPSSLTEIPSLLGAASLIIGYVFTDYRIAV